MLLQIALDVYITHGYTKTNHRNLRMADEEKIATWITAFEKRMKERVEKMSEPERLEIPTPWGKRKLWCWCDGDMIENKGNRALRLDEQLSQFYEKQGCFYGDGCCCSAWFYMDEFESPRKEA